MGEGATVRVHVTATQALGRARLAGLAVRIWPGAGIVSLQAHEAARAGSPANGLLLAWLDASPLGHRQLAAACERWQASGWVVALGEQFDPGVLRWAVRAGLGGYLLASQPHELLAEQLRGALARETAHAPQVWRALFGQLRAPGADAARGLPRLAPREREVLLAIGQGASNAQAAAQLGLSHATVASYVKQVYRKLGIHTRAQAALKAAEFEPIAPSGRGRAW